ncbi:MAG TPA: DUF1499 domain-containing protein [Stellaceae bacterium]|nr:DUF1499 domain-containing protein [Stellaceae bacterium]
MAEMTMRATESRMAHYVPRLGFWLAVLAGLMLAALPIGWRTGLLFFRDGFTYLMRPAVFVGVAAAVVSLIALFWWGRMNRGGRVMALLGLAAGLVFVYYPLQFYAKLYPIPLVNNVPLPRIHDITTDVENPPAFAATLAAREGEKGSNTVAYGGAALARAQHDGYPDIVPLMTKLAPDYAFKQALATAQGMSGWTIVKSDPAAHTIEGSQRSLFMGFTDDFVIRVSADGTGSRIDMRSESRWGISDFGVNAGRIRAYMAALKPKLS